MPTRSAISSFTRGRCISRRRKKANAVPVTPRVEYIEEYPEKIEMQPQLEPIDEPQPDGFFLSEVDETPQDGEGSEA